MAKAKGQTVKHKVLKHVHHDGELFRKGSTVELTADEAKPLIALGAVADPAAKPADPAPDAQ